MWPIRQCLTVTLVKYWYSVFKEWLFLDFYTIRARGDKSRGIGGKKLKKKKVWEIFILIHKWLNILSHVQVLKCHSWVLSRLKIKVSVYSRVQSENCNSKSGPVSCFSWWCLKVETNKFLSLFRFSHPPTFLYIYIHIFYFFFTLLKARFSLPDILCWNPRETGKDKQHFFIRLWSKCQGPECTPRPHWPCPGPPFSSVLALLLNCPVLTGAPGHRDVGGELVVMIAF